MQQFNFQDTYLRTALAFIGLNDIELITAEGGGLGPEAADRAASNALAKVSAVAA
jgi:FMN-dependent NADH-azoreductase